MVVENKFCFLVISLLSGKAKAVDLGKAREQQLLCRHLISCFLKFETFYKIKVVLGSCKCKSSRSGGSDVNDSHGRHFLSLYS